MLRILHVIPTLEPSWGLSQLRLVVGGLDSTRFESIVCALHESPTGSMQPLPGMCHRLRARHGLDLSGWWRWRKLVDGLRPELIHFWSRPAARWTALADVPNRSIVSEPVAEPGLRTPVGLLDERLARRAACLTVAYAPPLASAKTYPYTVSPAGVADPAGGRTRASLIAELGIPEPAYLLAAVGRLETRSRLKDLIWATDIVKFMRDDVHLLVVGDGPHRARLERFMRQCRVSDKVHFLGDRPDLHEWLGVVDVFLSASERPGQPLALLEAMATGRPVISTEVAGRADLIEDGRNGLLVPLGDRHLLARSIHRLVTDAALRRTLGEQAVRLVRDHFSASVAIEHWANTYDRLACHLS